MNGSRIKNRLHSPRSRKKMFEVAEKGLATDNIGVMKIKSLLMVVLAVLLITGNLAYARDVDVPFTNLQHAVDFIASSLESTNFAGIATACQSSERKPNNSLLVSLQRTNQLKPLRQLYAGKSFPTNAVTFKLGGHDKELGFIHIDFILTNEVWKLQAIWQCR